MPAALPDLSTAILKEYPNCAGPILDQLVHWVDEYQLTWVPDRDGKDAYFLMSEIAQRLKMSFSNVKNLFNPIVRTWADRPGLPKPRLIKLDALAIKPFQRALCTYYDVNYYNNHLWVCNWTAAYGRIALHNNIRLGPALSRVEGTKTAPAPQAAPIRNVETLSPTYNSELELQMDLVLLASYTANPFTRELTVINTLESRARTRRFDLCRSSNGKTQVIEIKINPIGVEDVVSTIADKGYIELANNHFDTPIEFIFVGPSITLQAQRLLHEPVSFMTVQGLRDMLFQEALDNTPVEGHWYIHKCKEMLPRLWS
jgi:hypothetical protein